MLAVAWGALIQLILIIPDEERQGEEDANFRIDGQYFIAPGAVHDMVRGESKL